MPSVVGRQSFGDALARELTPLERGEYAGGAMQSGSGVTYVHSRHERHAAYYESPDEIA